MALQKIIALAGTFFQDYTVIAVCAAVVLLVFTICRPQEVLRLLFFLAVMAVILYLMTYLTGLLSVGTQERDSILQQSRTIPDQ